MNIVEIQTIKLLFASGQYLKLYESQAHIINEILSIKTENEFQDFLNQIGWFDEGVFWLHYGSWHGKSLFVGAYDEDIADKVRRYLESKVGSMRGYFGYTMDLGTEKASLLALTMKILLIRLGAI